MLATWEVIEPRSIDVAFDDAKIAAAVHAALGHEGEPVMPVVGGRYRLIDRVGEGSFGSVYRALDLELHRYVAVKTLEPEDDLALGREARVLAKLTHPNVVRIYDHGAQGDFRYLVLELLDGQQLGVWATRPGRTRDEVIAACLEAGRGLAAAHDVGLVHRDFKPSNVMVTGDGRVVVVDFGLARHLDTEDGDEGDRPRAGTIEYMAPERLAGQVGDERSDQFSFCVALWELIAGRNPFSGETPKQRFASIMLGPGRAPEGGTVGRVLTRGLSKLPGDRHRSMGELLEQFEARPARRGRPFLLAAAIAAVMLIGIGLLPEGPFLEEGIADEDEPEFDAFEELLAAAQDAAATDPDVALRLLEQAETIAQGHEEDVLRCSDIAMMIGDALLQAGHRADAAKAYAVAFDGYSAQGLDELARWAALQVSVALDPPH